MATLYTTYIVYSYSTVCTVRTRGTGSKLVYWYYTVLYYTVYGSKWRRQSDVKKLCDG